MLWSPSEVLAYLKEEVNFQNSGTDIKELKTHSKNAAFGGFPTCSSTKSDFVFIAENSEIYGPNPLFTIPCVSKEIDLNSLATRILSADYQGLSSKKIVSLNHAQLLMPDASKDISVAVNYFVLFDTEARGFIRPTSIAYVTSDKYKLISCADAILKALSEASIILQHCNMTQTIDDLKAMLQEAAKQTDDGDSNIKRIKNKTEDISKDIQDIIHVIQAYEGNNVIDRQLCAILEHLKKPGVFSEVSKLLSTSNPPNTQPENRNQHSLQKHMKSLYSICGSGLILGLYHLYMMHKHFKRKYEEIYLEKYCNHKKRNDQKLYFGACVKVSDTCISRFTIKDCVLNTKITSKVPSMDSNQYFHFLDASFEKVLLDFLNWEKNLFQDLKQNSCLYQSSDSSDISIEPESICSSSSGYLSCEIEESGCFNSNYCGHIIPLENIWSILEDLQRENPDIESSFLEILKLFDDTKKILFSVFTRTTIVIISTPEECVTAQHFIKALSVFIPRRKDEVVLVEMNRQEALTADDLKCVAALNVCIDESKSIEEIIPNHLWHSLCILNLKDCSLSAPGYTGVLLTDIEERIRMLPLEGPAFCVIIGVLCEVQSAIEWWLMVTLPSADVSDATSSVNSKGFSRLDVQILLTLSKLCRS